jgi:hypothetical protein
MTILGAYREALVLVGGWAPYFILTQYGQTETGFQHVGSLDIDLAVDPRLVHPDQYASIVERLEKHGYRQKLSRTGQVIPFIFERELSLGEGKGTHIVQVDFLAPVQGGTGRGHRHQRIQEDLLARKARGCDIVFEHFFQHTLTGTLPDRAENTVRIKIADVVACLTMKGIVLAERYHHKDAYGIYSVVAYHRSGPRGVAQKVKPYLDNSLVHEAMTTIAEKFQSIRSVGPTSVASFLATGEEEAERLMARAFVRVSEFVKALGE